MMDCQRALNLISKRIDHEISHEEDALLAAHLMECASCSMMLEEITEQDQFLRQTLTGVQDDAHQAVEAAISVIQSKASSDRTTTNLSTRRSQLSIFSVIAIVSAAAGFICSTIIHQNFVTPPLQPIIVPTIAAHLNISSGIVQAKPLGEKLWKILKPGEPIVEGTTIRTASDSRCEIVNPDGSSLRLNRDTELTVTNSREFKLAGGRIWSSVQKNTIPFKVGIPSSELAVVAVGTQFDVDHSNTTTVVSVIEGQARLESQHWKNSEENLLSGGEQAKVENNKIIEKGKFYNIARATTWMNELLVIKGEQDPELKARLDKLLAKIGRSKVSYLLEGDIRALGVSCVPPLLSYIKSTESKQGHGSELKKRHSAARIATELAPAEYVPQLIELLQDEDGYVRSLACRALMRTTGQPSMISPKDWEKSHRHQLRKPYESWVHWYKKHQDRYPKGEWDFKWKEPAGMKKARAH